MELFARCDREPERLLAVTEGGRRYTLGDLNAAAGRLGRAVGGHRLVFLLCENTPGSLLGYFACLRTGAVPLLLDARIAPAQLAGLLETYRPAFVLAPGDLPDGTRVLLASFTPALEVEDSVLLRDGDRTGPELHPELALLLTTSGSTGSPKLVRLTGKNLDANARSIVEYLRLDEGERPVTNLAMSYSYGMSILNTHLLAGAAVVLTRRSVVEKPFWELVRRERVTSLAGVPYTYQMYRRVGLMDMELPALHTLTQAGGKLPEPLHREFADWAAHTGRRFYVMYGQTEATARMSWLPPEHVLDKLGSIGIAIPGGTFEIRDVDDRPIEEPGVAGELVYHGDNVSLGYATCAAELANPDERHGVLHTGDVAKRDEDGYYYIVGRMKRFLKMFGNRVNLDELENIFTQRGYELACVGQDDHMVIFTTKDDQDELRQAIAEETKLYPKAFEVRKIDEIPHTSSGKVDYQSLEKQC